MGNGTVALGSPGHLARGPPRNLARVIANPERLLLNCVQNQRR